MNKQEIWVDVCDECLNCENYWRNNDTETECEGEEKPCHEFRRSRFLEKGAVKVNKTIDAEILHDIITDHALCETQKTELEKTIEQLTPKKINKSSFNVAFCPVCHSAVWQLRHESKYCFRCGQVLEWRLEDE